tara:strand:+ start:2093 stop:2755 length:663 start_codon:yes stop_codon:yes gene_type:complete
MPRIGVYPLEENDLLWFLLEYVPAISNTDLLHHIIMDPLFDIREAFKEKTANPYVLREKHRRWCEQIDDRVGLMPMPTWQDIISDEYWNDCDVCSYLYETDADWYILGDDNGIVHNVLDEIYDEITLGASAEVVIRKVLLSPSNTHCSDLMLASRHLDRLYVIRSKKVEGCADVLTSHDGYHAFSDIGDALKDGHHDTYVMPDELIKDFSEWVVASGVQP